MYLKYNYLSKEVNYVQGDYSFPSGTKDKLYNRITCTNAGFPQLSDDRALNVSFFSL